MKLNDAIQHLEEKLQKDRFPCQECKEEHTELLEWLEELKEFRENEFRGLRKIIKSNAQLKD